MPFASGGFCVYDEEPAWHTVLLVTLIPGPLANIVTVNLRACPPSASTPGA
jgi:hypothetical protein